MTRVDRDVNGIVGNLTKAGEAAGAASNASNVVLHKGESVLVGDMNGMVDDGVTLVSGALETLKSSKEKAAAELKDVNEEVDAEMDTYGKVGKAKARELGKVGKAKAR